MNSKDSSIEGITNILKVEKAMLKNELKFKTLP